MKRHAIFTIAALSAAYFVAHHRSLLDHLTASLPAASAHTASQNGPVGASSLPSGLPNPRLTPGALNPAVNSHDLYRTICHRGWTRTVRPPENYTERLKRRQIREYGYSNHRLSAYELDHLVSLELGGSPSSPKNLWPEPHNAAGGWGSFAKDRLENKLNHLVCDHRLSLQSAQHMIATNWIRAYRRYIGPTPDDHRTY